MTKAQLYTCETLAAIVLHLREPGPKGLCLSGGADTRALCGAQVLWDTQIDLKFTSCRACRRKATLPEEPPPR